MASEIKTRIARKDIKAIDKAATIAQHMKHSSVQIKERAEQTQEQREHSPVEYAQGRIADNAERVSRGAAAQVKNQSGKAVKHVKEKQRLKREEKQIRKELREGRIPEQGERPSFSPSGGEKGYQPKEQMIKTAQSQAAKNAYRAAKASRKAAEKSAKTAGKATEKTVKAVAKTTVSVAKAIIAGTKALLTAIAAGGWIAILVLIVVLLFGAALSMTGGDNSSTVSPISAEVQVYEPLIRKYAKQYGIGEYVELIKAVMMQESGGQGNDPMQSSESSFNTKYPKKANGITNPEYSIECGVQEIKSCLAGAEVKSPVDMDQIKLALQGYNYGNGYIPWAKETYGGYTLANAVEFSDKMAKEKGWESYGDKQYVPHVLRYYSLGRIPNGTGNQVIVQVALAQEGNGGDIYWRWYGFGSRVSWCACFVSWCGEQCGYIESGAMPKFSLCSDGAKWFQSKGQFKDGSYVPAAGDIIFFDWEDDGSIDHVGIVESVGKGNVNTVEGNSGDKVKRCSYPIGDSEIYGYGTLVT